MWMDDEPGQRIGTDRLNEVLATEADTLAVGCPFCLKMFDDGLAARETKTVAMDIAELLAARI